MDVPGGAWTVYSSDVHSDIPTYLYLGSLELGNLNYKFINLDFK